MQNIKLFNMSFRSIYPHYVNKVEKKGRTVSELHQVLGWLTGYTSEDLLRIMEEEWTLYAFFEHAQLPASASEIKGVICGYRVEDIEDPLYQKIRYMDKVVDELAKGRKVDKIIRS